MAARGLADDLRLECRLRIQALLEDTDPCLLCSHPNSLKLFAPPPSGYGEGRELCVNELIGSARVDGITARAWIVGAEEGRGHSSLSKHFVHVWCTKDPSIPSLHLYQGVLPFNSNQVSSGGCWEAVKEFLPDTVARWGAPEVAEWLEENRVLIIIEDFDYRKCKEYLKETLEEWTDADFLLLTSPSYVAFTQELLAEHLPTLKFSVLNLQISSALELCEKMLTPAQKKVLGEWCESNWGITKEIITYPHLIKPLYYAWKSKHISSSTKTTTELLWNILEAHVAQNVHMEKDAMEKLFLAIGQLARMSLEDRNRDPIKKEEFIEKLQEVFPGGFADEVTSSSVPCFTSWLSKDYIYFPHPVKQFLAAWDVIHQDIGGVRLKLLTKYLIDEDSVVIYASGHLVRLLESNPKLLEPNLMRCAKNLILHMDRAKDRLEYILRVIYEIHSHPWIIDIFKKEIVFTRYWEVHDKAMLVAPIDTLLQLEKPNKILLLINKKREAPDLEGVIRLIARNTVRMCLLNSNHLEWENPSTTDDYIKILQAGNAKVEDMIGSLREDTIRSLGEMEMTKNVVCLRARVRDIDAAEALLNSPKHLPHLLWLEADFDMPLSDIEKIQAPEIETGLMDVCFKDINDENVPFVCEFLSLMRKNYSGIHFTRSALTPQGVTDILKQFYKRGMKMNVDISIVNQYRRWRFPILSTIPLSVTLTQEKVQHLLGYDDRHHYNDNEVFSSAITDRTAAGALANFLTMMEDLLCFRYACGNFIVIKHCNGTVEAKKLM